MFKVPSVGRLNEIMTLVPDIVESVFYNKVGYLKRVKYALLAKKIADECGVKVTYPINANFDYLKKLMLDSKIPDFAVLETTAGEYKISFGDEDEKDPVVALTRDYYEECTNGYIYVLSTDRMSKRAIKCIRRSAVTWYKNLLINDMSIFG